jgi:hypothetical protein
MKKECLKIPSTEISPHLVEAVREASYTHKIKMKISAYIVVRNISPIKIQANEEEVIGLDDRSCSFQTFPSRIGLCRKESATHLIFRSASNAALCIFSHKIPTASPLLS